MGEWKGQDPAFQILSVFTMREKREHTGESRKSNPGGVIRRRFTMLNQALKYQEMGLSVIPIRPDKKPYIKWESCQNQNPTPEKLRQWWKQWPKAMIGIVTGPISGVLVIDCDNEEAYRKIQELLPDSFITCIAKTPRGYHIYLAYPKDKHIGNAAGIMPSVDIRGEGGYIIAPPSINGDGKAYAWLDGLSIFDEDPAPCPDALYKSLSLYNSINKGDTTQHHIDHNDHRYFHQGTRDNDLFHAANCLIKGGCESPFVGQVLDILSRNSTPPFPENEIRVKIDSALKRSEKRVRDIAGEMREWVLTTDGHFLTTEGHKELQLTTRNEMKAANMALLRMCEGPDAILEKHGNRRGCYRRIDRTIEFMDFLNADIENTVDLALPLGLHNKTKIFPKGVIVVAGVSGMGKTLLSFNAIAENRGRFPIYYFNSEMGPEALKQKLSHFPIPMTEWAKNMKVIDAWDFNNIADKIQPDAFNVIDYLEPEGEKAFNIHGVISSIIRRLNKGTALITIQKKPGASMGTGGIYSIKAATLALALDWGKIEIVKNRFRESDPTPSLNKIDFEVHQGYEFVKTGGWYK